MTLYSKDTCLAVEMPVELIVDGKKEMTFFCTPQNLDELAIGNLLSSGKLPCYSDIVSLTVNSNTYQIHVQTKNGLASTRCTVPNFVQSGCTQAGVFNDSINRFICNSSDYAVSIKRLVALAHTMVQEGEIYPTTGGVHAAALLCPGSIILREDIGRHSAVDKVLGAGVKCKSDFSHCALAATGRISLDMLLKAASAGISVVASLKYPSEMGVRFARQCNITIVGRILSSSPVVYTADWRISDEEKPK